MNHYAILEGTKITGVIRTEGEYPGGTLLAQPWNGQDCPSPHHEAHLVNGAVQWVDNRPLEDIKAEKLDALKAERDSREFGTFVWDGSEIDCDAVSRGRIQGAVQVALYAVANGQSYADNWTMADNAIRQVTAADIVAMGLELAAFTSGLHATMRTLRQAVEDATSAAAVQAVAWPE